MRFVCSTLEPRTEFRVICQASDGLEAVQKAQELQPDLILLDIGLPTLNGIEAAKRIPKLAPHAKIVFLSQESSSDVVQEAIGLGALGYVEKSRTQSDLLRAIDAAVRDLQFVNRGSLGMHAADRSTICSPPVHYEVQFL